MAVERAMALDPAELNRLVLEAAGEGIYGLDIDGFVTFTNPAADRLLGYAAGTLLGQPMHQRTHAMRADGSGYPIRDCPVHHSMTTGQRWSGRELFWRSDGAPLPVTMTSTPLCSEGDTIGAVVVFSDDSATLKAQSDRAAALLEREQARRMAAAGAEREAVSRATMALLQESLHPATPDVVDPELGVYYLAAEPTSPTGGDLYDWVVMKDGDLHLSVIDVLGKGVAATKDALAVAHALRLLALAGTPLSRLVAQADELLTPTFPDLVATTMVARYRPSTGELTVASGGHPPVLLVTPSGTTSWVEPSGRAIGWPEAGSDDVVRVWLPPGGVAVFFTDGLVESQRDIVAGLEALALRVVSLLHLSAQELAQALVEEVLAHADRADDTLALVVRRRA